MCKKWKSVFAVGLAALLVCLVPARTMMAAEENTEKAQEAETDSDSSDDTANDVVITSDNQGGSREISAEEDGKTDGETDADENGKFNAEAAADRDGNVSDEIAADYDEGSGTALSYEMEEKTAEALAAPVINIKWWGDETACAPGGQIDYKYVNYQGYSIEFSAEQDGQEVSVSYCLDKVTDTTAEAKKNEEMDSMSWKNDSMDSIMLLKDGNYVLYVKAEAGVQIAYARSGGIVVDTRVPEIIGVEEGKSYPEGTAFEVQDTNLESVHVNGTLVTAMDGKYQVSANGTSACVIKAIDKAGNETICNIIISGKNPEEKVISETGTYSLKAGVSYQLAGGKWQVNGDGTVYRGGSTFYVRIDGDYRFTKH